MADRKISDLTALTTPAAGDYLPIVDISEAAAASKNKRITVEELMRGAPDGTAGAPGFAFESDPNTGIYSPGADQVAISTGGSGRAVIEATGRLGLGTMSPGVKVDILAEDNTSLNPVLRVNSNNVAVSTALAYDGLICSNQLTIGNTSSNPIIFNTNSSERLRITSAGLVGIGTSSPGALFSLVGSSAYTVGNSGRATQGLDINAIAGGSGLFGGALSFGAGGTGRASISAFQGSADSDVVGLAFNIHNSGTAATDAVEAMRLDSFGRLLVGTSTDSGGALLQVNGDRIRVATAKTPASASASGTAGEICWDANYIYVCTATNTWKRTAIATW